MQQKRNNYLIIFISFIFMAMRFLRLMLVRVSGIVGK